MSTTRKGKIARLPRPIREQLNRRLDDNEPSAPILEWLNTQPEVQRVLAADFNGRPISEQNLSEWRQGGFVDWLQHQESREWALLVADEADQVDDDIGVMPLSDRLSTMAAVALGKVIRTLSTEAQFDSEKRDDLLRVLKELARLRRHDLDAARSRSHLEYLAHQRRLSRQRTLATATVP